MTLDLKYEIFTNRNIRLENSKSDIKKIDSNYFVFKIEPIVFEYIETEAKNNMMTTDDLVSQLLKMYLECKNVQKQNLSDQK